MKKLSLLKMNLIYYLDNLINFTSWIVDKINNSKDDVSAACK